MQDLTQGSIPKHLIRLAAPLGIGMLFQTMYYLIDLFFVAKLGDTALAGVSAAGNVQFIIMGMTQILGVGAMALIAQAVGRRDREDANLLFNQSVVLAALFATITIVGGYGLAGFYMQRLGADAGTVAAGTTYLYWFLPALGLQFAMIVMGSALRGTGIAKPTMIVQVSTVAMNAILAPILIAGWGTGRPLGVAGAGLASSISVGVGVILMGWYFARLETYVSFDRRSFRPQLAVWKRMLRIGLPPGGEFALMFLYMAVVYWIIRDFGADAQAGFGIGSRVMQAIFLPAMAIAFATAPIAAQNVGAGRPDRVREAFRSAALMGSAVMLTITLLCQWRPDLLLRAFVPSADAESLGGSAAAVLAVGALYLQIISWNFVASSLIFTCSSLFQALGNTLPAVLSGATRFITFVIPGVWLAARPGFTLRQLWLLSVASVLVQLITSLLFLRRELHRRLGPVPTPVEERVAV